MPPPPGIQLGQQQRLSQQMLAPHLQLTMQLLPMNTIQLSRYLQQQLDHNPFLGWRSSTASTSSSAFDVALATATQQNDLTDHLLQQLHLENIADSIKQCAEIIIDALDQRGYFLNELPELYALLNHEPGIKPSHWQQALTVIQTLEPTGVGARHLVECLRLQLEQSHLGHAQQTQALTIVEHHLQALRQPDIQALASQLNCDPHDISLAIELIQSLNPRPGLAYSNNHAEYVRADLKFSANGEQPDQPSFSVELLNAFSQQLLVHDKSATQAAGAQRQAALSLVSALMLREQSLLRVGQQLAKQQAAFLAQGPAAIRPLTRQHIAEQLNLHPSTVTRTLQGKYADTPNGLTPLKDFFSTALINPNKPDSEPVAATAARAHLNQLIANENPLKPLSDAQLCRQLQADGFPVARRTVMKYRQQLGLANSRVRRRE